MDDCVWTRWPREGGTVYVETFAPSLREVEFLPDRWVREVALYAFYSEALARRSLECVRRRYPQSVLVARRMPLDLGAAGDAHEYRGHLRAVLREARLFSRAARA